MRTRAAVLAFLIGIGGVGAVGCAESSRVETSTTTTSPTYDSAGRPVVVQKDTSVTKVENRDACDGVLSCTVDFAGTVIAFPFKLVGSLFGAIFCCALCMRRGIPSHAEAGRGESPTLA
jgi:hypothetical protein